MECCHWINEEVKIDFPIPGEALRNTIDDCERYDRAGDARYFGMARAIDVLCKESFANGHMSQREWDTIISRYPEW